MIRHLTPADYKTMAWANGKGVTVEMLRVEVAGAVKWRLSRASVVEDGDFSLFAGIERNLTVITGPGFDLVSASGRQPARPLQPVAFPGDIAIRAEGVTTPSDDFNVMTARGLRRPEVVVIAGKATLPQRGTLAIFALDPTIADGMALDHHDLLITDSGLTLEGHAIAVRLFD